MSDPGLPLAGLRVLDMADERSELCGRLLADLGADVVRVEPPGGSPSRRLPPRIGELSAFFEVRNFNKRSAVVDLDSEAGRERLLDLLGRADVWIETTKPGRLAAVGLDPVDISCRFPHLVVASLTDFGQTGPYRDFEATDDVLTAIGGEIFRSGVVGRPPLLVPGSFAYDVSGVMGAFAVLTAYWQKLRTGSGQHLDFSILEACAQSTDWSLANYSAVAGTGAPYLEVRAGSGIVYPMYPCKDGYVRLVILSPRQWHAMREWLGDPEFLKDPHWDSLLGRMSIQEDILDPLYAELFMTMGMSELSAEAQRRGIVMTPVMHPRAVLESEHFQARRSFAEVRYADVGAGQIAASMLELNGRRAGLRTPAPALGEHDAEIEPSWPDHRQIDGGGPPPDGPRLPFEGLRVIDFGHGGVGVEVGRLFAEYGADVIKIESRAYPDFIRLVAGSEMSPSFASSSRSKRSLGVNIKTPEGLELIKRLIAGADVVIENNSTGTMDDLGLGWSALREVNPGVVMVSSQLMGSTGPWSGWLGYGPSTRPAGGMTWLWNFPDGDMPPGASVIFPDHLVGRVGAVAGVAGLIARERTGEGAHFEAAQVETVLTCMAQYFLQESLDPGSVKPAGNRSAQGAPWGVYQCAGEERWVVITCRHDDDWSALRKAMGDPEWAADPALSSAEGRHLQHDLIDAHISEWTAQRSDRQAMETLQAFGVPAGMMTYASDEPNDPHLQARGYLAPIDQPGVGPMILEGPAFYGSAMDRPRITAAPALGEHTRAVATALLGLDDEETEVLIRSGVLEVTPPVTGPPASANI
ncbi:MAG: CoA transferase [Acidobacteriota bacterium]|nr:CoA transferase [Acidobacteriota bacterium]